MLQANCRLKGIYEIKRAAQLPMLTSGTHVCFISLTLITFPYRKEPSHQNEDYNYQSAECFVDLSLAKSSIIISVLTRVLDCEVSARSNIFSKLDLPERDLYYCSAERDNQADSPADNIINTEFNLCLSLMHC